MKINALLDVTPYNLVGTHIYVDVSDQPVANITAHHPDNWVCRIILNFRHIPSGDTASYRSNLHRQRHYVCTV
jgi:hypothetical protein